MAGWGWWSVGLFYRNSPRLPVDSAKQAATSRLVGTGKISSDTAKKSDRSQVRLLYTTRIK